MSRFELRVEWLPPPEPDMAFGPERSTWARLEIRLNGELLTANHPADDYGADRPFIIGGMSGLADWIVEHWLAVHFESHTPFAKGGQLRTGAGGARFPSARDADSGWASFVREDDSVTGATLGGWQQRHTLGEAAADFALPSIVFVPEDTWMGIGLDHMPAALSPTVRFTAAPTPDAWPAAPIWVPMPDVSEALERFVDETIARAAAQPESKAWADWLRAAWRKVRALAADPGEQRRWSYGPVVAQRWADVAKRLGSAACALEEILRDSAVIEEGAQLDWLADQLSRGLSDSGAGSAVREPPPVMQIDWDMPLWREGYRLAQATRQRLGLSHDPLPDPVLEDVLRRFGISVRDAHTRGLFRGAVWPTSRGATLVWADDDPRHSGPEARRFTIAAVFGRALAMGTGDTGAAAHGQQSRWRPTQLANAFAAEFLLPVQAVRNASGDVEQLRRHYGISRAAAEWHVANRLDPGG
jgi:hypothetical protein